MHIVEARRGLGLTEEELQRAARDRDRRDEEETDSHDDLRGEKRAGRIHVVTLFL